MTSSFIGNYTKSTTGEFSWDNCFDLSKYKKVEFKVEIITYNLLGEI